ncbi:UNVERIFIED_CONTAM: hypothetical protein NCL1_03173 [Trichonephila clavipes]
MPVGVTFLVQWARAACPLRSSAAFTINMWTSSSFEYEFIRLPQEMDHKLRLPAGSVFLKFWVQCHLPQGYPEESSRMNTRTIGGELRDCELRSSDEDGT